MTSPERFRVMVVDEHPVVREGVRYVLETSGHFEVVVEASDGEEAVTKAASQKPDVIVMDVLCRVRTASKPVVTSWSFCPKRGS